MALANASKAQRLASSLALTQTPVAVATTMTRPTALPRWSSPVAAGCRFWQEAAQSSFYTEAQDHALCAIGTYTHNLATDTADLTDRHDALAVFADLGYVRSQDLPLIPVLDRRPTYIVYGPLAEFDSVPEAVLLFVRANQQLILAEAAQQVENQLPPAMGRPACAIVPQAINSGRSALSLGCCGARAYLDIMTDDVALYALPGSRLDDYIERIEALAKANTVLTRFHQLRRQAIVAGSRPTIKESLATLASASGDGQS